MYITDGFHDKRVTIGSEIPEGWHIGRMKSCVTTAGSFWVTDGIENILLKSNDSIPDGFRKGRTRSKEWVQKQRQSLLDKKYKCYNDGEHEIFISINDIVPDGFVLGRLPVKELTRKRQSEAALGKKLSEETKKKISEHSNNNREKAKITCLQKYGVENVFASKEIQEKSYNTKRKNHTFNTSKSEVELKNKLVEMYGEKDILTNYKSSKYPYRCDFYIVSLDKYIELNAHWTHGGRPYDPNDPWCQQQLKDWQEKAKQSQFYAAAIDTWTRRDVEKLQCAKENNLDYEVIY